MGEVVVAAVMAINLAIGAVQQVQEDAALQAMHDAQVVREEARAQVLRLSIERAEQAREEARLEHERQHAQASSTPSSTSSVWDRLAQCESNGEWDYGPHSGWGSGIYEGGVQFHPTTWDAYRDPSMPDAAYRASREQQIVVAERVLAAQGWRAWPSCSRKLGLR